MSMSIESGEKPNVKVAKSAQKDDLNLVDLLKKDPAAAGTGELKSFGDGGSKGTKELHEDGHKGGKGVSLEMTNPYATKF